MKNRNQLKTLLLQIREDVTTRAEEFESFLLYSGLHKSQMDVLNVFDTPHFSSSLLGEYDALFVGGTSDASVLEPEKFSFFKSSYEMLNRAIEISTPTFASCFGFQMATIVLGGKVTSYEKKYEIGTIDILLTKEAALDPMFSHLKNSFPAVSVHKEEVLETPPQCTLLAYTDKCCHSFRVNGKPFWAFQFHPEVDKQTLIDRLTVFKDQYTNDSEHLDQVLREAIDTPLSNQLVNVFVESVLLKQ